jgi:hypothetical protein
MKIFIYKSLVAFFLFLVLFKLTVGSLVTDYEKKFDETLSKDSLTKFKSKLREEIKSGIKKERILNEEDAVLIKDFLDKISKEINEAK